MTKTLRYILIVAAFLVVGLTVFNQKPKPQVASQVAEIQPSPTSALILGVNTAKRTKTSGCVINAKLPDSLCTPGAVFPDVTKEQVCVSGYSKNVRNVPESEKNQVYAEYSITTHITGEYEVDHLVSLELGGSNDISNLWPEAASPRPGFHEKDVVENYLHQQVCSGALTLEQAQNIIATDWQKVVLPVK